MWNEILNLAIKNGIWAVLFLGLFVFVIKDSSTREKKYQQTIKDLTAHLGIVNSIKEDINQIKNLVFKSKKPLKNISKTPKNTQKNAEEPSISKNSNQLSPNKKTSKSQNNQINSDQKIPPKNKQ